MILSVSRRTDIPAFYGEWFFNRIQEGFVYVRNPMNYHQVSCVSLAPDVIDCIVFWSKNPAPMLDRLHLLADYRFYFQVTINAYDRRFERNVPSQESVVETFKALSAVLGKDRVIWRYDPIILSQARTMDDHIRQFSELVARLDGYTERCVISFIDLYRKSERNMKGLTLNTITASEMRELGGKLSEIAHRYHLDLETCSETIDLSASGIQPTKCIDDRLIAKIIGESFQVEKDKNQRAECGCVASIDIGAYNSCRHGCIYCYANYSDLAVRNNCAKHDPASPLLIGQIDPEQDKVTFRKMERYRKPVQQLHFEGF